jgi:hypothetical protein
MPVTVTFVPNLPGAALFAITIFQLVLAVVAFVAETEFSDPGYRIQYSSTEPEMQIVYEMKYAHFQPASDWYSGICHAVDVE